MRKPPLPARLRRGFTLLELMVSMSILSILMLLVFEMFGQTQRAWTASRSRVSTFKEARVAFESLTRRLSMAMLNTYTDYNRPYSGGNSTSYVKQSEMHFICGRTQEIVGEGAGTPRPTHAVFFQAPVGFSKEFQEETQGMHELLNSVGYYVEFGSDEKYRPQFLQQRLLELNLTRERFRLMEFRPPAERMFVYRHDLKNPSNRPKARQWFDNGELRGSKEGVYYSRPIAENIIALVIEPRESRRTSNAGNSLAPSYLYDSQSTNTRTQHKLPPIVDVTMVAVEESSILRFEQLADTGLATLIPTEMFKSASAYDADIRRLESILAAAKIDYRIFRESVTIRASRWEDD